MPKPNDERAMEAAARIRAVRNYLDITQQELADRIGVSLATMKRMESGLRPISTDELLQVADACDFPTGFLIHGKDSIVSTNGSDMPHACMDRFGVMERRIRSLERRVDSLDRDS